jgi:Fic family protein
MPRGRPSRDTIFARFAAALDELQQFGGLPTPAEAGSIWDDIWHLEAHNSTAIEGNTLALREVEKLLDKGTAVGAKPLKDYLEVRGYGDAARWVYAQARGGGALNVDKLVTITEIREVHRLAMSAAWEIEPHPDAGPAEGPGAYRRHDIRPFGRGMVPPSWTDVGARLTTWVDQVNDLGGEITADQFPVREIPLALARIHAEFEQIHPFLDGNGRTGRLVLNLALVRLGFPPAIVFKRERNRYLQALDQADRGDPGALGEQLARSVIDNLHRFVVPNIAGPARIVPLRSLADDELSYEALRQAARRGKLEAHQGSDGIWRASRHAVTRYKASRYRRE